MKVIGINLAVLMDIFDIFDTSDGDRVRDILQAYLQSTHGHLLENSPPGGPADEIKCQEA